MAKIDLKSVIWKEGSSYVALCLNNNVSSFGDSKEDALASLQEALELYFEDMPASDVVKIDKIDVVPLTLEYA